ncbi:XRE family transcriptional regulator [Streptomyces fragilis]|uniref:AAA family ATPase n=1 Tax=Streptomyces fragilis TaxID=67301 RepID=A0ABV2YHR9_9ACTN|nr:XRE family transcriptional regulator [Streptomyces fragilis]
MTHGLASQDTTPAPAAALGALILQHRLRIGLTQRELADLSTISVRAIRDLEKGKAQRPRTDTVRLIADGLRLGPRARAALEEAAQRGHRGGVRAAAERPAPPVPLHPLIGREAECAAVVEELRSGAERLVTVVGLSGVGKTRLVLEAAARLHDAGLAVLWHSAPGAAVDFLPGGQGPFSALAADCAAFLRGEGRGDDLPGGPAWLPGDRGVVLVLDGADTGLLDFHRLGRLLRELPGVRLLVTADEPWNVPGERLFLLSPLDAPEPSAAGPAGTAASRFFLDQLRRLRPGFVPDERALADVAWICHRLDGHPMSLAAAASWLAVYDLPALRSLLESDPYPLLAHLADGPAGSRLQERVARTVAELPAPCRDLLAGLCRDGDGAFLLEDVVRLTGRPLPECGRMLRDLLVGGVVRSVDEGALPAFRVLCVVRAVLGAAAVATAA